MTQTITIGSTVMSQNYGYDALNRLSSASETGAWTQTYDYDRYGNRAVRSSSYIPQPSLTPQSAFAGDMSAFSATNNRIVLAGFGYDSAGNLTGDPTTAANGMVYDAENRQISYTKGGVTTTYSYDGEGRRVKKSDSTGTIIFVYNAGGQLIAEYTSGSPTGSGTSYLTSDHLGSTRVVMKPDGSVARHDYLPFGEEINSTIGGRGSVAGYGAADATRQRFTQKERDNESGLDYFLARYYSSAQGRFTSPDEFTGGPDELYDLASSASDNPTFYADLHDPQSLNKYQYCYNNPLAYVDPNGHQISKKLKEAAGAVASAAGQVLKDTFVGGGKELYNAAVGVPNAINTVVNAGLSLTGTDFRFDQLPTADLSTPGERSAGLAIDVILIYQAATSIAAGETASAVNAGRTAVGAERGASAAESVPKEGIYEFPDAKQPGRTYVGQSGDVPGRLATHETTGKRAPGSPLSTTAVQGGKTAREVAEHRRINQLGGTRNVPGSGTSNLRNPIGSRRRAKIEQEHGPLN